MSEKLEDFSAAVSIYEVEIDRLRALNAELLCALKGLIDSHIDWGRFEPEEAKAKISRAKAVIRKVSGE